MKWFWSIVGMIVLLVLGVPPWVSIIVAATVWFIIAIVQSATGDGNRSNRNDNATFQNINRTTTGKNNHAATRDNNRTTTRDTHHAATRDSMEDHLQRYNNRTGIQDDSVIDITDAYVKIPTATKQETASFGNDRVPYWQKEYIYSIRSLEYAGTRIKGFYKRFKDAFVSGNYLDLDGNENYAFTLMFDLLNEYDEQPDLTRLTKHMEVLMKHYPETSRHVEPNLIERAKKSGQWRKMCVNGETSIEDIMELFPRSREWSFSDRYSEKLGLNKSERELFTYFESKWNSMFSNFEFMKIKQVQLYREVMKGITEKSIYNTAISFNIKSHNGMYDYSQSMYKYNNLTIAERVKMVKNCIFRLCRNKLNERYELNNRIDIFTYEHNESSKKEITRFLKLVEPLIDPLTKTLPEFTDEDETEINSVYRTRWRSVHEELKISFNQNKDVQSYIQGVNRLAKINKENPGVRHLLFDASKLLAGVDNMAAMKIYLQYIDVYQHFSNNNDREEKFLPKYACKKLFKEEGQQSKFEDIITWYKTDQDRKNAYEAIDVFYMPPRRKLHLDKGEIARVKGQHSETVQLLNQVMNEEDGMEEKEEIASEEKRVDLTHRLLTKHQLELLGLFKQNDLCITKSEVESFAKSKGLMANSLIEKINDLCYEELDDVLIEDEEEFWSVSDDYLNAIIYENQN